MPGDVPSPIDLRTMKDAREWERTANQKRPARPGFFEAFLKEIKAHNPEITRILELGSGPGLLADHILNKLPLLGYVALDFSNAMHQLARQRLANKSVQCKFVEGDFKHPGWTDGLGSFQCVVTNQAVHELRHKRHAQTLHQQVRSLLPAGGLYLVCDHFAGNAGMENTELFMTTLEQREALTNAGFSQVQLIKIESTLAMYRARNELGQ